MKLVNKISLYNILLSAGVIIIGGILLFLLLDHLIEAETKHELRHYTRLVQEQIKAGADWQIIAKDVDLEIELIEQPDPRYLEFFFDETETEAIPFEGPPSHHGKGPPPGAFPPVGHPTPGDEAAPHASPQTIPIKRLTIDRQINGQWFRIKFGREIIGVGKLINTSLIAFASILTLAIGALFFGNRLLFKRVFRPFYDSLERLESYKLSDKEEVAFPPTSTEEFAVLNQRLAYFIRHSQREYTALKEFSENASHELQTPIAIIRSKLDQLLQSPNLGEKELSGIEDIQQTLQQAVHLNKTLLLLTKIGNQEFSETELIDVKVTILHFVDLFSELIQMKELDLTLDLADYTCAANPYVLDLLFSNLIHNAIKHNVKGGTISIRLTQGLFQISNTGRELEFPTEQYFNRFKKGSQQESSSGLGLAIVKQICDVSEYEISYQTDKQEHRLSVRLQGD